MILRPMAAQMWGRPKRTRELDRPDDAAAVEGPELRSDEYSLGVIEGVFDAAKAAGYTVRRGNQQIMLYCQKQKVGGWNTIAVQRVPVDGTATSPMVAGGRGKERPRVRLGCADLDWIADEVADDLTVAGR